MTRRGILLVLVLVAMLTWATVWGYPRPSPSPRGWQLDFEYGPMKQIRLVLPGESNPKTFWYMPYTVTNNTGRDVSFYPRSYLFTDTGQLIEALQGVDALAYPLIAKLIGRELLEEELFVRGKLLQGEENARESVIIWRDFDPQSVSFKLFISGLSGETAWVTDPMSGKKYSLVKTLQLSYGLGGDRYISAELTAQLKDHEWIMR
ncbi:MAG: hypothetical protein GWP14_04180 [Actinobacteria bacterium]|nr:hypothetical protein [Actinomycetota bacterium]